jgi:hypothetical protein
MLADGDYFGGRNEGWDSDSGIVLGVSLVTPF